MHVQGAPNGTCSPVTCVREPKSRKVVYIVESDWAWTLTWVAPRWYGWRPNSFRCLMQCALLRFDRTLPIQILHLHLRRVSPCWFANLSSLARSLASLAAIRRGCVRGRLSFNSIATLWIGICEIGQQSTRWPCILHELITHQPGTSDPNWFSEETTCLLNKAACKRPDDSLTFFFGEPFADQSRALGKAWSAVSMVELTNHTYTDAPFSRVWWRTGQGLQHCEKIKTGKTHTIWWTIYCIHGIALGRIWNTSIKITNNPPGTSNLDLLVIQIVDVLYIFHISSGRTFGI